MDSGTSIADLLPGLPAAPAAGPPEATQAAEFKNVLNHAAARLPDSGSGPSGWSAAAAAQRPGLVGGFRPGGANLPPGSETLPLGSQLPLGAGPGAEPDATAAAWLPDAEALPAALVVAAATARRDAPTPLPAGSGPGADPAPVPLAVRDALRGGPALPLRPALPTGMDRAADAADGAATRALSLQGFDVATTPQRSPALEARGSAGDGLAGLPTGVLAAARSGAEPAPLPAESGASQTPALLRPDAPAPGTAAAATPGRSLAPGQFELPLALNDARWENAFANRVSWVVSEGMSAARLNVYPPELGQIELRVTFSNDQASVQFGVQHASVRDAVEQALPRLREMFEAAGIALGDTSVATQQQDGGAEHASDGDGATALSGEPEAETLPPGVPMIRQHHGLVDAFV